MNALDYWQECISNAAEDAGLSMTADQLKQIAESVEAGHDNYGMAFYSPPSSDRLNDIKREYEDKIKALELKLLSERRNAETAVRQALGRYRDAQISIGEHGEVFEHGGRTTQIQ